MEIPSNQPTVIPIIDLVIYRKHPDELLRLEEELEFKFHAVDGEPPDADWPTPAAKRIYRTRHYRGGLFNQTVGFVRIYAKHDGLKCQVYKRNFKHAQRGVDRHPVRDIRFVGGKLIWLGFLSGPGESNEVLAERAVGMLKGVQRDFQQWFIDMEPFVNIAPFVDWNGLSRSCHH